MDEAVKCVGFSKNKNGEYVFAICGAPERKGKDIKDKIKAIKSILGESAIRATVVNTFTIFPCVKTYDRYLKIIADDFYYHLESCNVYPFMPNIQIGFLNYNSYLLTVGYDSRIFSCAERKIVGKLKFESSTIYVGRRPCALCLGSISSAVYLTNSNHIASIEKTGPYTYNQFSFLKKIL